MEFKHFHIIRGIARDQVDHAIEILTGINQSLLEIDGDIFSVVEFIPADNSTPYHFLRGRLLNEIIVRHVINAVGYKETQFLSPSTQYSDIIQRIGVQRIVSLRFHSSFPYKEHTDNDSGR